MFFAFLSWHDPDRQREHAMFFLLQSAVVVFVVTLAFFYNLGGRFGVQVNFQKIAVFIFCGGKSSIQVWFEGNMFSMFTVNTPAFRLQYGELLGVHICGAQATELIAEAALALKLEATAEELAETIHPHPTLSECLREAALAAMDRAVHISGRKR